MTESSDGDLMERTASGDKLAFTDFLQRHLQPLVMYIKRYVPQTSDAEEIAQESFTRVWSHAQRWQASEAPAKAWLYRIAYNLCMDFWRRDTRYESLTEEPTLAGNLDQKLDHADRQALLSELIAGLPERQRTALWLCTYQTLSNSEAASVMQISIDALESLLARARRSLRKRLISKQRELQEQHHV